jgi:hypothetical protein
VIAVRLLPTFCVAVRRGQRLQTVGLFESAQVLALKVLDQRELHDLGVRRVAHDARQLGQTDLDRGAIATLAGDDLEASVHGTHEQGLEDPVLAHRRDQLREVADLLARLAGVGLDVLDRDEAPHGRSTRPAELVHVVRVVTHAKGLRQSEAAGARHVR